MKIYIAAYNDISEKQINKAKNSFIAKFKTLSSDDFVRSEPNIIWFLTGGSEHNALEQIESHNKYAFIASAKDNSWAAATEVKALLNAKGINTRIFDLDKLDDLSLVLDYLKPLKLEKKLKLGLLGNTADWLVASSPDKDLLSEVLNIDVFNFTDDNLIDKSEITQNQLAVFKAIYGDTESDTFFLYKQLLSLISAEKLDALAIDCFGILKEHNYTACLPLAAISGLGIPVVCEGDLCSAAGIITLYRLSGKIPWMANLMHVDKGFALFSHCTAPIDLLESFDIDTHFESGKGLAVKGKLKNQQVTVFRLDQNLEHCFLSLGEIVDGQESQFACRTQAKIKMSSKSLFLLREFPLGNHHLIVAGDYTDVLAEYFTNKGLRIV